MSGFYPNSGGTYYNDGAGTYIYLANAGANKADCDDSHANVFPNNTGTSLTCNYAGQCAGFYGDNNNYGDHDCDLTVEKTLWSADGGMGSSNGWVGQYTTMYFQPYPGGPCLFHQVGEITNCGGTLGIYGSWFASDINNICTGGMVWYGDAKKYCK